MLAIALYSLHGLTVILILIFRLRIYLWLFSVGSSKKSDICSDIDYNVKNGLEPGQDGGDVISNTQYRVATAIYPSASMMNHSW